MLRSVQFCMSIQYGDHFCNQLQHSQLDFEDPCRQQSEGKTCQAWMPKFPKWMEASSRSSYAKFERCKECHLFLWFRRSDALVKLPYVCHRTQKCHCFVQSEVS